MWPNRGQPAAIPASDVRRRGRRGMGHVHRSRVFVVVSPLRRWVEGLSWGYRERLDIKGNPPKVEKWLNPRAEGGWVQSPVESPPGSKLPEFGKIGCRRAESLGGPICPCAPFLWRGTRCRVRPMPGAFDVSPRHAPVASSSNSSSSAKCRRCCVSCT